MFPIHKIFKPIIKHLRGQNFFYVHSELFRNHSQNFLNAKQLLRAFYGLSFIISVESFHWMTQLYSHKIYYDPLWLFYLFDNQKIQLLFTPLMAVWSISSLLAFVFIEKQIYRAAQAFAITLIIGIVNSDGHYAHNNHALVWISLIFAIIPTFPKSILQTPRIRKHQILLMVWGAQFAICTFYLMTGYWKVASILNCATNSQLSCQLDHWILTNITAREAIYYNQFSPWRDAFYKYPWVSFFSYMATIWIHLASLYFVFRLNLHKVFGFFRLIFHLGTFLFFGVNFSAMAYPVSLIFLLSPFARDLCLREMIKAVLSLPPFNLFTKGFFRAKRTL